MLSSEDGPSIVEGPAPNTANSTASHPSPGASDEIQLSAHKLIDQARQQEQPQCISFPPVPSESTIQTKGHLGNHRDKRSSDTGCSPLRGKDIILSGKATIELVLQQIATGKVKRKWMILVGAFVCQVFSAGFGNSVGVFFVEFLETFHSGRAVVGWATSICSGLVFGAGMFVGILVHEFGPRLSTILGGFLSFVGLLACSLAPNIAVIFITFGILTGTGCCLVCVASFVAVGQHFDKGRGAASSIAVAGSGTGALIFPIILRPIIDEYGWRGTMIILSALMLNTIPAAGLFIAPKKRPCSSSEEKSEPLRIRSAMCSSVLWKNRAYVCYVIICPVIAIGYKYTYIVIVDLGILKGFTKADSTMLLVYMGLAYTVSTLCFGFILRVFWSHTILLFNICLVAMSAIMFFFSALKSYGSFVFGATAYGAAVGGISGLYAVVTVDMIGLEMYSTGLGIVCTAYGIGYLLSAPMAGLINDTTGSYNISFYIAGTLCLCGAIPFALVHKCFKQKAQCKISA